MMPKFKNPKSVGKSLSREGAKSPVIKSLTVEKLIGLSGASSDKSFILYLFSQLKDLSDCKSLRDVRYLERQLKLLRKGDPGFTWRKALINNKKKRRVSRHMLFSGEQFGAPAIENQLKSIDDQSLGYLQDHHNFNSIAKKCYCYLYEKIKVIDKAEPENNRLNNRVKFVAELVVLMINRCLLKDRLIYRITEKQVRSIVNSEMTQYQSGQCYIVTDDSIRFNQLKNKKISFKGESPFVPCPVDSHEGNDSLEQDQPERLKSLMLDGPNNLDEDDNLNDGSKKSACLDVPNELWEKLGCELLRGELEDIDLDRMELDGIEEGIEIGKISLDGLDLGSESTDVSSARRDDSPCGLSDYFNFFQYEGYQQKVKSGLYENGIWEAKETALV